MKNLKIFHNGRLAMTNIMSPKSTFDSIDTSSLLSWWRKHFCPCQPILLLFSHFHFILLWIWVELMLKFTFFFSFSKCEPGVDKVSTQMFFEGENTFSLPEDVIKRLNKSKKCISFNKKCI